MNSPRYYLMLAVLGIFILGPLGGVTASYMNFSIGFFVGGQVLAGILGSTVTLGYGPEGKHGANYMQTAAASVAGMAGMGVLIQAMVWMGLPQPPVWQLMLFMGAIGMFGAGVGMLYTPILVDRLAADLSVGPGGGQHPARADRPGAAQAVGLAPGHGRGPGPRGRAGLGQAGLPGRHRVVHVHLGAGLLVGARIGVAALVAGLTGTLLIPLFVNIGWLQPGEPFRKITFLIGLGLIMGAAILDIGQILVQAWRRWRSPPELREVVPPQPDWQRTHVGRLVAWVVFWGAMVVWVGASVLNQPVFFMALAMVLVFVFAMVNGISLGISDSNPISSAFVTAVVLMAALGLKDPTVGLMVRSTCAGAHAVGFHVGAAAALHDLAALHHQVLVGQFGGEVVVLLHQHDGHAVAVAVGQHADHAADVLDDAGLDAFGGLVQHQQRGPAASARRDGQLLLLAAGQVAAAAVHHLLEHGEQLEQLAGMACRRACWPGPCAGSLPPSGGRRSRGPAARSRCRRRTRS
jgi:hypothetical protein